MRFPTWNLLLWSWLTYGCVMLAVASTGRWWAIALALPALLITMHCWRRAEEAGDR